MMEEKSGNGRKGSFREALLLILIGVGAFVGLSHLDIVGSRVWSVIRLFMPLIIGGIVAFILNVPMHGFEKLLSRRARRRKKPLKEKRVRFYAARASIISSASGAGLPPPGAASSAPAGSSSGCFPSAWPGRSFPW